MTADEVRAICDVYRGMLTKAKATGLRPAAYRHEWATETTVGVMIARREVERSPLSGNAS